MDSSTSLPLVTITVPLVLAIAQNVQNGHAEARRERQTDEVIVEEEDGREEEVLNTNFGVQADEMDPETRSESGIERFQLRQTTLDDWLLRSRRARCCSEEDEEDGGLLGLGVLNSPSPSPSLSSGHARPRRVETSYSVRRIPDEPLSVVGELVERDGPFRQQAISSSTLLSNGTTPGSSNEMHDTTTPWPHSERLSRYRYILPSNYDSLLANGEAHPILLPHELIFVRVRWCDDRAISSSTTPRRDTTPQSERRRWYSFYTPDIPLEDVCRSLTKDGECISWIEHGDCFPQKVDESDWLQQVGAFDTGREVLSFVWHVCEEGDGVHCPDGMDEMEE